MKLKKDLSSLSTSGTVSCGISSTVPMTRKNMTTFQSKDDVLTLLVHLGYLAYHHDNHKVSIPNTEIRGEFVRAVKGCEWKDVIDALEQSDRLLSATWNEDSETPCRLQCHEGIH